ncbi:MAG TPA: peptide-methionine (S)-S-oxide reductase [Acidimicrobiales bacterium]|nr:peptide-methionine (S)-S-oxide reductase [Acidimicrobiales bacterium]
MPAVRHAAIAVALSLLVAACSDSTDPPAAPAPGGTGSGTEPAPTFYWAEDYHQQYLAKNPMGYCGLGGTGVSCPIGLNRA